MTAPSVVTEPFQGIFTDNSETIHTVSKLEQLCAVPSLYYVQSLVCVMCSL